MKKYVIVGGGDFLSDVFDLIHAHKGVVHKIFLNVPEIRRKGAMSVRERANLLTYDVEVYDSLDGFGREEGCDYLIGCVTVHKYRLVEDLKREHNIRFASLVHPAAHLGSNVRIGEGVIVSPGTVIAPNVSLDDFCAVNRGVSIGHDARVGRYSRIGPSVAMAGGTSIGDRCSIGMAACILDRVSVGDRAVIGAGSVVTKDVPEKVVAYGVPAKVVKENDEADFSVYKARRFPDSR